MGLCQILNRQGKPETGRLEIQIAAPLNKVHCTTMQSRKEVQPFGVLPSTDTLTSFLTHVSQQDPAYRRMRRTLRIRPIS